MNARRAVCALQSQSVLVFWHVRSHKSSRGETCDRAPAKTHLLTAQWCSELLFRARAAWYVDYGTRRIAEGFAGRATSGKLGAPGPVRNRGTHHATRSIRDVDRNGVLISGHGLHCS